MGMKILGVGVDSSYNVSANCFIDDVYERVENNEYIQELFKNRKKEIADGKIEKLKDSTNEKKPPNKLVSLPKTRAFKITELRNEAKIYMALVNKIFSMYYSFRITKEKLMYFFGADDVSEEIAYGFRISNVSAYNIYRQKGKKIEISNNAQLMLASVLYVVNRENEEEDRVNEDEKRIKEGKKNKDEKKYEKYIDYIPGRLQIFPQCNKYISNEIYKNCENKKDKVAYIYECFCKEHRIQKFARGCNFLTAEEILDVPVLSFVYCAQRKITEWNNMHIENNVKNNLKQKIEKAICDICANCCLQEKSELDVDFDMKNSVFRCKELLTELDEKINAMDIDDNTKLHIFKNLEQIWYISDSNELNSLIAGYLELDETEQKKFLKYVEKVISNKGDEYSFEGYLNINDKESLITKYSEKIDETMIEEVPVLINEWDLSDSNDEDWYVINSIGRLYIDYNNNLDKELYAEVKGALNYNLYNHPRIC